jgi:short-subunit dehydrogenase
VTPRTVVVTFNRDREGAERTAEEVRSHGRRAEVRDLDLTRLPGAADVVDELADALDGDTSPVPRGRWTAGCCR